MRAVSALLGVVSGLLRAPAVDRADLGVALAEWCENATAYLTEEVNSFGSEHDEAAVQLHNATAESRAVANAFAALSRAALPQSTDKDAGIKAAQDSAEVQQSTEYRDLLQRQLNAKIAFAAAAAAFKDTEVLKRTLGNLLGATLRACRQEKDLEHSVEQALAPGALPVLLQLRRTLREVPVEETLRALRQRKEHQQHREQECAHMRDGQARIMELKRLSEAHAAAAAEVMKKHETTSAELLAEFREVKAGVAVLEEGSKHIFDDEQRVYSDEAMAAETAKELDTTHNFWMQWRQNLEQAFASVRTFVGKRIQQLDAAGVRHEHLRASRSSELHPPKSAAPDGLACPSEEEEAARSQELDDAIAQIEALSA